MIIYRQHDSIDCIEELRRNGESRQGKGNYLNNKRKGKNDRVQNF